jgi:TIR domain-containing protein/caspase domain-containing protein
MPPTPKGPSATKIFISYSRKDRAWLERLKVHLKPLESFGIERWDDTRLETGELWREQIERAIGSAKVAILLVSADFLASNFIENEELPPLLAKAEQKGTVILPVILTACLFSETKSLSRYMTVNPPSEPLDSLNESERNEVWVRLARTILDHLSESKKPEAEAPPEDLFSDVEVKAVTQATPPPEVPAPIPAAGPEGGRHALLVVNDKYDSPAFAKLVAQSDDSRSLESVLTSHDIGGFNVTTLRNESYSKVTQEVKAFFSNRRPEDVLLLYYYGIGLKDDS